MSPPLPMSQDWSGPFKVSVVPELFNVPTTLTVPPTRLNVPKEDKVKLPPRFTVLFCAVMLPALSQLPLMFSVAFAMVNALLLVHAPARLNEVPIKSIDSERFHEPLRVNVPEPPIDRPTTFDKLRMLRFPPLVMVMSP